MLQPSLTPGRLSQCMEWIEAQIYLCNIKKYLLILIIIINEKGKIYNHLCGIEIVAEIENVLAGAFFM